MWIMVSDLRAGAGERVLKGEYPERFNTADLDVWEAAFQFYAYNQPQTLDDEAGAGCLDQRAFNRSADPSAGLHLTATCDEPGDNEAARYSATRRTCRNRKMSNGDCSASLVGVTVRLIIDISEWPGLIGPFIWGFIYRVSAIFPFYVATK